MENRVVLITGGAGFIGAKLCEVLLNIRANVICFDNFSSGNTDNLQQVMSHPNFKLIGGDIRNLEKCKKAMNGVDYVFHLADLDYNSSAKTDECTINDVNGVGFLNILTAIHESEVKGMMYSTCCSYSSNYMKLPKIGEVMKGKALSAYVISKYSNELYANLFRKKYGLQIKGVEYTPIFDKTQSTYVSKIIQLNMDALNSMLREEYLQA